MIKIKLNDDEKIVTRGAYENFYEHLGYEIMNDDKKVIKRDTSLRNEPKGVENKDTDRKDNYSRK